jgi:SAM-dependent methyltransferase
VAGMTGSWLAFWDKPHAIYVNARHKDVHYRLIAKEIAALVPSRQACVLDYGCGEALHAAFVAAACGELLLCDGAPSVRAGLAARFAGNGKIRVLAPDAVALLPHHSLDFIVLHSVAQYLASAELQALLAKFRELIAPSGILLVSDITPPRLAAATDVAALLRFGMTNGFLLATLGGLTRTLFSDYRRLRTRYGLTHYGEADMLRMLAAAGFDGERASKNIGHNQARMAFVARPRLQKPDLGLASARLSGRSGHHPTDKTG